MTDLSGCACNDICETPCLCDVSGCIPSRNTVALSDEQALVESTWGLRSRLQQLEDLSGNVQVLRPLIRPPSFEQLARYKPSTEYINQLYIQTALMLLRVFTFLSSFLRGTWSVVQTVGNGLKKSFTDDIYVFFEGSDHPYRLDEIRLDSPGVPHIAWYYNATKNTFVTSRLYNNSQHHSFHHIPFLSAEIKYNELTLFDISEFMNGVRWAGEEEEEMPSVNHIVSAWTITSGVVVKRGEGMILAAINSDGNDVNLALRNEA